MREQHKWKVGDRVVRRIPAIGKQPAIVRHGVIIQLVSDFEINVSGPNHRGTPVPAYRVRFDGTEKSEPWEVYAETGDYLDRERFYRGKGFILTDGMLAMVLMFLIASCLLYVSGLHITLTIR